MASSELRYPSRDYLGRLAVELPALWRHGRFQRSRINLSVPRDFPVAQGQALSTLLDELGMTVAHVHDGSQAVVDALWQRYTRAGDRIGRAALIELSADPTEMTITECGRSLACARFPFSGTQLDASAAKWLGISLAEAHRLRRRLGGAIWDREEHDDPTVRSMRDIVQPKLHELAEDIRDLAGEFGVDRLLFHGEEAACGVLCSSMANLIRLPWQFADVVSRLISETPGDNDQLCRQAGIDRRDPQPQWTRVVALALPPVESHVASSPVSPLHCDAA